MASHLYQSPPKSSPNQLGPYFPLADFQPYDPTAAHFSTSNYYASLQPVLDDPHSYYALPPQITPTESTGYHNLSMGNMPNLQSMNSAALVAAALGPTSPQPDGKKEQPTSLKSHRKTINLQQSSSSLSELSDTLFVSETNQQSRSPRETRNIGPRRLRESHGGSKGQAEQHVVPSRSQSPVKRYRTRTYRENQERSTSSDEETDDEPAHVNTGHTQRPKRKRRLVRKKTHGVRVPQTLDDANPSDRMMWEWKNMGKTWQQIRDEWYRITGIRPGTSTLSVRYLKLNENFARHGAAGDRELLRFKQEADEELKGELWTKVAEKMLAFSELSEHNPRELKKRYDYIMRTKSSQKVEVDQGDAADVVVKDESENEVRQSKIITLPLPRQNEDTEMPLADSSDQSPGRGRSRRPFPRQEDSHASSVPHQDFQAPFSYNLDYTTYDQDETSTAAATDASGLAHAFPPSATAQAIAPGSRNVEVIALDDGPPDTRQHPSSQVAVRATASSPQPLASSPFLKTLVAYGSDDE